MARPTATSDSLAILAAVWRSGRSGTLVLQSALSRTEVLVVRGGLVKLSQLSALRRAVEMDRMRFELGSPAAGVTGDRVALGGLVLDLFRGLTALTLEPVASDSMVRLAIDGQLLRGLVSDQLVDRLERRSVAVGALLRDGSATVLDLRALQQLDALSIDEPNPEQLQVPPPLRAAPLAFPEPLALSAEDELDQAEEILDITVDHDEPDELFAMPEPVPAPPSAPLAAADPAILDQFRAAEGDVGLAAPMAAPPPSLGLIEDDEEEILAMCSDDEEVDLDPPELYPQDDSDDLLALGAADDQDWEEDGDGDTVLSFSAAPEPALQAEPPLDADLLCMPEADEAELSQDDSQPQAVLRWGGEQAPVWADCADIQERVADSIKQGPRHVGGPRPDLLDVVPFGEEQEELGEESAAAITRDADVWEELDLDGGQPAADVVDWDDEDTLEALDELDTVDELFRRAECIEDIDTDGFSSSEQEDWAEDWGPDEEPSLAASMVAEREEDTDVVVDSPPPVRESITESVVPQATAIPEELTGELSNPRLRVRDESTAEIALDLLNRARAELAAGRLDGFRATLERADSLAPDEPTIEVHMAWAELLGGHSASAAQRAMHAVSNAPYDDVVMGLASAMAGHVGTTVRG